MNKYGIQRSSRRRERKKEGERESVDEMRKSKVEKNSIYAYCVYIHDCARKKCQ